MKKNNLPVAGIVPFLLQTENSACTLRVKN
jgi:hypothetical protein